MGLHPILGVILTGWRMAWDVSARFRAIELIGPDGSFAAATRTVAREFSCDPNTVMRFLWGPEVVHLKAIGAPEPEVEYAMRRHLALRGSESAIQRLERAFVLHYWVQPSNAGTPEFKQWWRRMSALLDELRSIGTWAIDNFDVAQLASEHPWPFPGGWVDRSDTGISITLAADQKDAWSYLRGRYPDLPLWTTIEQWRTAAEEMSPPDSGCWSGSIELSLRGSAHACPTTLTGWDAAWGSGTFSTSTRRSCMRRSRSPGHPICDT